MSVVPGRSFPIRPGQDLAGLRAVVMGLGRFSGGVETVRWLVGRGAELVVTDLAPAERLGPSLEAIAGLPVTLRLGEPFPDAANFDLVVPSPGVPRERYQACARRAWGDVELAFRALAVPVVAITGTNGKSTTTAWTAHVLQRAGVTAVAAGNIGHPLSQAVLEGGADTVFVVEVSSFQLEDSPELHPSAAAILNLTPDHLDRHGDFAAYRATKWAIAANQQPGDRLVLGPGVEVPAGAVVRARIVRCDPAGGRGHPIPA